MHIVDPILGTNLANDTLFKDKQKLRMMCEWANIISFL